jgi:cation:H+ antiporter
MSNSDRRQQVLAPVCALLLISAGTIPEEGPYSLIWTAPAILVAAMLIAWAAESAQYFMAQGVALAILAWLQTLPEFAVEAVFAWKQQVPLLMAGLTGALRLLTGLGWPMIYCTAAYFKRRRGGRLREIVLEPEHSVEVVGLIASMLYSFFICWTRTLDLIDAAVLIAIYSVYLYILSRMPAMAEESVEEMERIPRAIVTARRPIRIAAITGLFLVGGGMIYFAAEPFLGSLLAVSTALGIPVFVFVQWVAPFVSEFPEKVSAFYWARTVDKAPTALMNMISSNINQWTLLAAMLPIVYSISRGSVSAIPLDAEQQTELLLTLAQALLGALFLLEMKLQWWEATGLFVLWFAQFVLSPVAHVHRYFTFAYFAWAAADIVLIFAGRRKATAFACFAAMWRRNLRRPKNGSS